MVCCRCDCKDIFIPYRIEASQVAFNNLCYYSTIPDFVVIQSILGKWLIN